MVVDVLNCFETRFCEMNLVGGVGGWAAGVTTISLTELTR